MCTDKDLTGRCSEWSIVSRAHGILNDLLKLSLGWALKMLKLCGGRTTKRIAACKSGMKQNENAGSCASGDYHGLLEGSIPPFPTKERIYDNLLAALLSPLIT